MKKSKFYRVIAIVLCLAVLLCTTAFAKDSAYYPQLDVEFDSLVDEDYTLANQELLDIINNLKKLRTYPQAKYLSVPVYYQNGQTWSNDEMQTSKETIGESGCTVTSYSMILNYFGSTLDPGDVNMLLGNSACPFDYETAANIFDMRITQYKRGDVTNALARDYIGGAIMMDRPVLVGMRRKTNVNDTHFVVARAYVDMVLGSPAKIYINDPSYNRTHIKTDLDEYIENG